MTRAAAVGTDGCYCDLHWDQRNHLHSCRRTGAGLDRDCCNADSECCSTNERNGYSAKVELKNHRTTAVEPENDARGLNARKSSMMDCDYFPDVRSHPTWVVAVEENFCRDLEFSADETVGEGQPEPPLVADRDAMSARMAWAIEEMEDAEVQPGTENAMDDEIEGDYYCQRFAKECTDGSAYERGIVLVTTEDLCSKVRTRE